MRRSLRVALFPCLTACLLTATVLLRPCSAGFAPDKNAAAGADSAACDTPSDSDLGWLEQRLNRHFGVAPLQPADSRSGFVTAGARFDQYTGRIIDEITFTRQRLFSDDASDSEDEPENEDGWLRDIAEATHVSTRDHVLRNNLLIHSGDRLNPRILADNERLLRGLPFIDDARIVVTPDENHPIYVDVEIITRDRWSLGASAKVHGTNNIEINIFERSFLGLGHNLENEFFVTPEAGSGLGYRGKYGARNLGGSFVDSHFEFRDTQDEANRRIDLNRDLISSELRLVGGLTWNDRTDRNNPQSEAADGSTWSRSEARSLWVGRVFPLERANGWRQTPRRLILSTGIDDLTWSQRPPVSADEGSQWWSRRRYLTRVTLAGNSHFEGSWVRGFGRTEDMARGYLFSLVGGLEESEFEHRPYFGFETGIGETCRRLGYFNARLGLGGFRNDGGWRQSSLNVTIDYYSNLAENGSWKFRQFLRLTYTRGWDRKSDDKILLGDDFGIHDLPGNHHEGQQRLVLNYESIAFSPVNLFGFHVAGFAFCDAGIIAPAKVRLFSPPVHASLGFGLRIKNESLVFRTIEIRFSYFPGPIADENRVMWNFASGDEKLPEGFYRVRPGIIEYQ